MSEKYGKLLGKELIDLANLAYERELGESLHQLDHKFEGWRLAKINARQLNESIHLYHKGVARELWHKYVANNFHDLLVAQAIAGGILKHHELSTELLTYLEPKIKLYQSP